MGDSISWSCSFFLRRIPAKLSQFPHNFRTPSRGVFHSFSIEFPLLLQWTKAKGQGKASHACAPGAPKCVGTVGSGPDHFLRIFFASARPWLERLFLARVEGMARNSVSSLGLGTQLLAWRVPQNALVQSARGRTISLRFFSPWRAELRALART